MKTIYFFLVIFSLSIIGQVNIPKQLTNFNFDSRNPVFLQYPANVPGYSGESEVFFEAVYNDSLMTICSLEYNEGSDSFYNFTEITPVIDSNIIHRNSAGQFVANYLGMPYKILLWETNGNGNWDIASSIDSGNGWSPYSLMFSSLEDELNPSFIMHPVNYYYQTQYQFLYSKGNSVFFCSKIDSLKNDLLFEGNDSIKYSNPAGAYSGYDGNIYVVAVEEKNGGQPKLVYRVGNLYDSTWSVVGTVFERAPSTKPRFVNPGWGEVYLSFEVLAERTKRILLIRPEDFGMPGTLIPLLEDPTIETSDFSSFTYGIVTKESRDDFYTYFPFTFRFQRNDSTYIRVGVNEYYLNPYSDFPTKVNDSKPAIGPLSIVWEGALSYAVWEDSSDGRINLFGLKRIDPLGDVKDESNLNNDFNLLQNYPNPFNPTTIIQYELSRRQFVTLKIYNLLGGEIATLVNEEKQPGVYKSEFDASHLSSGIYFYQLKAGLTIQTKKMVLLR